jgi:leucyl-tRNA synthetase
VLRITKYADRLIEGLKETAFIDKVKAAQINWIGKSEGARIKFEIKRDSSAMPKNDISKLEVFTTRPDTLYGATFMVIAPEHKLIESLKSKVESTKWEEIQNYVKEARKKSEMERTELSKDKTGVFSGLYAINPVNNKEIPIWISDFVLSSYGTGAIMAVPAHDERDFAFAKKFKLEIRK